MPRVRLPAIAPKRRAWNKGRIIGQKRPLLPKQVWAIRARLELARNLRDLALFSIAIDSKLRGCDLVKLTSSRSAPNTPPTTDSSNSSKTSRRGKARSSRWNPSAAAP